MKSRLLFSLLCLFVYAPAEAQVTQSFADGTDTNDGRYQVAQAAGAPASSQMELEFWNSVKDSNDSEMLRAYIEQFPDGSFVSLAKIMLQKLGGEKEKSTASKIKKTKIEPVRDNEALKKSNAANLVGSWKGYYLCAQGKTGLTIEISGSNTDQLKALFSFNSLAENSKAASGSFELTGSFQSSTGEFEFKPSRWINQPSGYDMVGFVGSLKSENDEFLGTIIHETCGELKLSRLNKTKDMTAFTRPQDKAGSPFSDAQAVLKKSNELINIYRLLADVFTDIETINGTAYRIVSKEITSTAASSQVRNHALGGKGKLNRANEQLQFFDIADFADTKQKQGLEKFKTYLTNLSQEIDEMLTEAIDNANSASAGKPTDPLENWKSYFRRIKSILTGENWILGQQLGTYKKYHPQKSIIEIGLNTNEIMISLIEALNSIVTGNDKISNSDSYLQVAKQQIQDNESQIKLAETKINEYNNQFVDLTNSESGSTKEKRMLNELISINQSYHPSLDVELKINSRLLNLMTRMQSANFQEDEFFDFWEIEFSKIDVLIQERLKLDVARRNKLSNLKF